LGDGAVDLWTFRRYRQPRLCVDAIEHDEPSRIVTLRAGTQCYRLAFDDPGGAAQTAAELATLRNARAPLWTTLRLSPPDSAWSVLGNFLDTHSLIAEAENDAAQRLAVQRERIDVCIHGTVAAVLQGLPPARRASVAVHALAIQQWLNQGVTAESTTTADTNPFDAAAQPNFYLGLVAIEIDYLRAASPLTLEAVATLLAFVAGREGGGGSDELAEACGLDDERDLAAHLWLIANCLVLSTSDEAARFPLPPLPEFSLSSGLEFMRRTELLTRETLSLWGPNCYVRRLEDLGNADSPLIAGPFIEQYHVTRRFLEIIAPLLSKRLSGPLRSMMFRYFAEESGHEALEGTTCEALGVSEIALNTALPLPLHFAFVDCLTLVARLDPIASFAAIMVIEGIFGEPPRMSLRLAAVGRGNPRLREVSGEHDALNETLNHNSIPRDAFEHISAISPGRQVSAMHRILFLLELNHRAWDGIATFYGGQETLSLQGPLGSPLGTSEHGP
jgi:hypothetical protein